jgi:lipoate-protein ligase B
MEEHGSINCIPLGLKPFSEVFKLQLELRRRRQAGEIPDTILSVEHPKVITRGRRPSDEDFRIPPEQLRARGYEVEDAGRGGRLTYHGPGQLVVYFILSLKDRRLSIPQFVGRVEEALIHTLAAFDIAASRREGYPGVWVQTRKIASVGFAVDRGVSMNGIALNVDPKLKDFEVIIPCGISNCEMTSMRREKGRECSLREVEGVLMENVARLFGA